MELCKNKDNWANLEEFFLEKKNKTQLEKLCKNEKRLEDGFKQNGKKLVNKYKLILDNPRKAMQKQIFFALGDTVISIDTPDDFCIVTGDKSFEIFCDVLGKKQIRLERKPSAITLV